MVQNGIALVSIAVVYCVFGGVALIAEDTITLRWEWPADRTADVTIRVYVERVQPAPRGLLGIDRSPSLGSALPDPWVLIGTVVHGPNGLEGEAVSLRHLGRDAESIHEGSTVSIGLLPDHRTCIGIEEAASQEPDIQRD